MKALATTAPATRKLAHYQIQRIRQHLVEATAALRGYKWRTKGDNKAKLRAELQILASWLHCLLWVGGSTKTKPQAMQHTYRELLAAMQAHPKR